jgi:addiction module HigA family antidote
MTETTQPPKHPGEVLREEVLPMYIAAQTGLGVAQVKAVLACREPITGDTAERLARWLKGSAADWNKLQRAYDAAMAPPAATDEQGGSTPKS